jgi:SpoVK/Ycf46/Vps4 family AAA+-type ATPase
MIGKNEQPLIRENYSKELMEDYDKAITALKDNTGGRIVILQGPAGTGKTFQIRGMITDLDFVSLLIPASLVSELDGPAFLPLLLDINRDEKDKPILIIVEDGDDCLINRDEGNNMSAISSLLNVSDGILGSILDIKIVVSTNAEIKDIDKAILRPGRLCAHLFVDPLLYGKSMEVIRRLSKNEKFELPEKREYVLAELYAIANDKDFHSHVGKLIKKIGF